MTAEIAIINKEAIALAADSAVTINTGSGRKIYNTVNKLFALTKHAPVGIMVYGRADLMGIPWESIIKTYRPVIGTKTFETIDEYVSDFVAFLRKHGRKMFPASVRLGYFRSIATTGFSHIRTRVEQTIKQTISSKGKASLVDVQKAIDGAIDEHLRFVASKDRIAGIRRTHIAKLKRRYGGVINEVQSTVFQQLPISKKAAIKLSSIPVEVCCRRLFSPADSGVVIAGFGDAEMFPFLKSMVFGGMVDDILRYQVISDVKISHANEAVIKPFAQSEMVEAFMEGIDPGCQEVVKSFWRTIMVQFPQDVANSVTSINAAQQGALVKKLSKAGRRILDQFDQKLRAYVQERHIDPVVDAVAVLPKDLLAEVA